jgi:hypothetical protein
MRGAPLAGYLRLLYAFNLHNIVSENLLRVRFSDELNAE